MTRRMLARILLMPVAAAVLAACAGDGTRVESDLGLDGAPGWVNEGSQALNDRDGRLFHGVGSAPPMQDSSLQIATADNRARAEVARVLSSYMEIVSRDYTAASGTGGRQASEQAVSRQIDNLTRLNMSGVRIIAHWRNPETDIVYSLAELDMAHVKDVVAAAQEMSPGLAEYIRSRGDNIFDRMSGGER